MPKNYKFNYQGKTVNAKELSKIFKIPYSNFYRIIKSNNCRTLEDVKIALEKRTKFKVGDKYGKYTIISDKTEIHNTHILVEVQCECGKITKKLLSDLKNGLIQGCANCMAQERSRKVTLGDVYKSWKVVGGPRVTKRGNIEYLVTCTNCGISTR